MRFPSAVRPRSTHRLAGTVRASTIEVSGYRPKPVSARELPGYLDYVTPLSAPNIPVDSHGVALALNKGRKVYHPLVIARYGITLLQSYRITQHKAYLDRVSTNASFLLDHAVSRDGALYFPYRFTYALFGNRRDLMRAPWYSAMAQSAALTLFVRLYAATGDQRWRAAADAHLRHLSTAAEYKAALGGFRPSLAQPSRLVARGLREEPPDAGAERPPGRPLRSLRVRRCDPEARRNHRV